MHFRRMAYRVFIGLFLLAAFTACKKKTLLQTVTFKPGPDAGKDAQVHDINSDKNYGQSIHFMAKRSSHQALGGYPIQRGYLEFDLSRIPVNATVVSAVLTLHYQTTSAGQKHQGNNECELYRVVDPWDENTITWNHQPGVTSDNMIAVGKTTSSNSDLTVNVTKLINDMRLHGNHGFLFKLKNESGTRRQAYASSDSPNSKLWPELEVTWMIQFGAGSTY